MASVVKEVLNDLSPAIKQYADGTVERLWTFPYVPPSLEDPATGVSSKDVTISSEVSARLYLPKLASGQRTHLKIPILIYYHGGGFCLGSAFSDSDHRYINALSAASGALVVSVEYRLAPEHLLPAAYEDSWEALKWVCYHSTSDLADQNPSPKDNWISNHGNLNRLFISGDSAGANIAHNLAIRVGSEPLPVNAKITGVILSHPFFRGSDPMGNEPRENIEQDLLSRMWRLAYPLAVGGIDNPLLNPLVDGAPVLSGLGCSRMFVCVSSKDTLRERGVVYAERVRGSGWRGEIEVVEVEDEGHCFHVFYVGSEKAKDLIGRFASFISR